MRFEYQCPIGHDDGTETVYDVTADYTPKTRDSPEYPAELELIRLRVHGKTVPMATLTEAEVQLIYDTGYEAAYEEQIA